MPIVFYRPGESTAESHRIEATACISIAPLAPDAVQGLVDRIAATTARLPDTARVCIDATYRDADARLDVTLTGGVEAMRLMDRPADDGTPLFEADADCLLRLTIDPVRYELRVALGDHLTSAAKNHPPQDAPLSLLTRYDEERERLDVEIRGTVFAAGYLLFLTWLQVSQSRYR